MSSSTQAMQNIYDERQKYGSIQNIYNPVPLKKIPVKGSHGGEPRPKKKVFRESLHHIDHTYKPLPTRPSSQGIAL